MVPATAQFIYQAHDLDKPEIIGRILQAEDAGKIIVFTRTKRQAQRVADDLAERGFSASPLHGDMAQVAREKALTKFREDKLRVLVATDVAARGIDVAGVSHVINYTCPEDDKTYVHRIGRTGRAGATGIAITFVDWADLHRWKMINKALDLPFDEPQETYSTSEHLFHDPGIPPGTKGRIVDPAPVERKPRSDRNDRSDRSGGGRSGGGRSGGAATATGAATAAGARSRGGETVAEGGAGSAPAAAGRRGHSGPATAAESGEPRTAAATATAVVVVRRARARPPDLALPAAPHADPSLPTARSDGSRIPGTGATGQAVTTTWCRAGRTSTARSRRRAAAGCSRASAACRAGRRPARARRRRRGCRGSRSRRCRRGRSARSTSSCRSRRCPTPAPSGSRPRSVPGSRLS